MMRVSSAQDEACENDDVEEESRLSQSGAVESFNK